MTLRFVYLLLLLCLLLLTCDHGNAAKDLKEKHSSANFNKNRDEAEEKSSSKSSYGHIAVDEADEKIARLGSKYEHVYRVHPIDEPNEKIASLKSKDELVYGIHPTDEPSEKIASLQYELVYGGAEHHNTEHDRGHDLVHPVYEPKEKIAGLQSEIFYGGMEHHNMEHDPRHDLIHLVDEPKEKIAGLQSELVYGGPEHHNMEHDHGHDLVHPVEESNEKIAGLQSELVYGGIEHHSMEHDYRHDLVHPVDETKENIAGLRSRLVYGGAEHHNMEHDLVHPMDEPNEKIAGLQSRLVYGGAEHHNMEHDLVHPMDKPNEKIAGLQSKLVYGGAEHHNMEHDDDIGSEVVGVFTVGDVHAFDVGRKLSTFFSIRNRSLYPGFLPREVADSIPFSSADIPKILQFFSVIPDSPKGKAIRETISLCEALETAKGVKICATSSESMLEFLKTTFGEADIKLISTSHPTMTTPILQKYTVLEPPREIESPRKVACHPLPYLYGIYMCHYDARETKIFKVLLVGDNGDKVDALIVCHMDTSAWNPKHVAFSLLGTKLGTPVCHTFPEGHGVWIQSSPKKVAAV